MTQGNLEVVGVRAVVAGFEDYVRKTGQIQRSTDKMGKGVSTSASSFRASAKRIAEFSGALIGVDVGLRAVNQAFRSTIGASIGFESAFAGVEKTVDATEEQFDALRSGLRDMATEIPLSVNGLAAIAEAAGQLGIETESILGFTETMAMLGETTNLSADTAATALARLANITQLPQDQFSNLGSTIVALGNNFATTEAEITSFGLRIAGAGTQIGLTQAEILAFGTALSSVGINAEAGGTAISRVFVEIDKAVRTGGDSLTQFAKVAGVSADEFVKAYQTDAAGAITTFIEGLGAISAAGGDTFAVLETLELDSIRVRDALLRASGAGGLLRDALDLSGKAFEENTALQVEFAKRAETSAAQFQVLKNRVNDLGIDIGNALVPSLLAGATATTGWLDSLRVLAPLLPTIALAVGALVAVLAVQKLVAFASGIGTLTAAARTAVIGNAPLLILTGAVVGLDLALRAITGGGIFDLFAGGMSEAEKAAEDLGDEMERIQTLTIGALTDQQKLDRLNRDLAGSFRIHAEAIGRWTDEAVEAARAGFDFDGIMRSIGEANRELAASWIANVTAQREAGATAEDVTAQYDDLSTEMRILVLNSAVVRDSFDELERPIAELVEEQDEWIRQLKALPRVLSDAEGGVGGLTRNVELLDEAMAESFDTLTGYEGRLAAARRAIGDMGQALADLELSGEADFAGNLDALFRATIPLARDAGEDVADAFGDGLRTGGSGVAKAAKEIAMTAAQAFFGTLAADRHFRELNKKFGRLGADVIAAFEVAVVEKSEDAGQTLGNAFIKLVNGAADQGVPISEDAGQAIMNALAEGIELGTPEAIAAAFAAVQAITDTLESGAKTAVEIFRDTLGQIEQDKILEQKFGAKGASIWASLIEAMQEGGDAAARTVATKAAALVDILAEKLGPARAASIGAKLFAALAGALDEGGAAVLAELEAILADIASLLGEDGGGNGTGGGGGGSNPSANDPGLFTTVAIRAIQNRVGINAAVARAVRGLELGFITFGELVQRLPDIAAIIQEQFAGQFDVPGVAPPPGANNVTGGETEVGSITGPEETVSPGGGPGAGSGGFTGGTNITQDFSGAQFTGTVEENAEAIARATRDILADEQGVGAFDAAAV